MKLDAYIKTLQTQKRLLVDRVNPINAETAAQTQKEYANRIFEKGLKSDETKLGRYISRPTRFYRWNFLPMYYNRFKATGFRGVKGGKPIPYMTLLGYKQLKDIQGLRSSFVDLTYTGLLKKNISQTPVKMSAGRVSESRYGVTVNNSIRTLPGWPKKRPFIRSPKTNAEKVRIRTEQYGEFITHTRRETITHIRRFDRLLTRAVFSATPLQGQPTIIL